MMQTTLLKLHAQTAIHAGCGQNDSVIDLPVQRESHTGYPCIFGSSVKGALRTHAETRSDLDAQVIARLFGKEGDINTGNTGAVLVSDARLLLLPMRSLTGQFFWVTCPNILMRLVQDSKRFGKELSFKVPTVGAEEVLTNNNVQAGAKLYLEEYQFTKSKQPIDESIIKELATYIAYDDAQALLTHQLAMISDDNFAYLAKYTLPVTPHIALDSQTKVTKNHALWYEETLPSDAVLYVGIMVEDERKKEGKAKQELAKEFSQMFNAHPWLQVGGNETVGMGWCSLKGLDGFAATVTE